jgi:hypothetical protein
MTLSFGKFVLRLAAKRWECEDREERRMRRGSDLTFDQKNPPDR